MKEKILAGQLAKGDTAALRRIIRSYSGYVRTVVRNFSRGALSGADIDEITADIFYRLWEKRENLSPELGLRPYLSASARNAVKNRFRSGEPPAEDISGLDIPLDLCLEEQAELGEMMRCLNDGLKQLPEEEREIFFRFYFYGERSSGIAEKLGISENSVNARLHRIRGKLREFLKERGFDHV